MTAVQPAAEGPAQHQRPDDRQHDRPPQARDQRGDLRREVQAQRGADRSTGRRCAAGQGSRGRAQHGRERGRQQRPDHPGQRRAQGHADSAAARASSKVADGDAGGSQESDGGQLRARQRLSIARMHCAIASPSSRLLCWPVAPSPVPARLAGPRRRAPAGRAARRRRAPALHQRDVVRRWPRAAAWRRWRWRWPSRAQHRRPAARRDRSAGAGRPAAGTTRPGPGRPTARP